MSDMMNNFGLFWNSTNGDRKYNAESFEEWLKKFFTSGVFANECEVTASSGMTVVGATGYANVDGKVRFFRTQEEFTLSPANSRYPRIDTIVIERNNTDREITRKIVTGAYSGNTPVPTPPVRSETVYQLVTAQIYVGAGVTSITQANITDTRADNAICGYVTGTVTEIDWSQITAQFEEYMQEFRDETETEFYDLLQQMHDLIDQETAGHLQEEINHLNNDISIILGDFATVEPAVTASKAYDVGDYLVLNKMFYKVIAAIAQGDTLVVDGNIKATNVGTEVSSLNKDLAKMIKNEVKSITFNGEGDATLYADRKKIPVIIFNNTGNVYPIFLPYQYGNVIRVRALNFSAGTTVAYITSVTLSVRVFYIDAPTLT